MGKTLLTRLAAAGAGGALALAVAVPAMADDHTTGADLRQSDVFADDPEFDGGFGACSEKPDQAENEDIWVFVWPGNNATALVSLTLNFDSTGDGVADQVRTEADATPTTDSGTLKVWVTTPAGWMLVDGTSVVEGTLPGPPHSEDRKFNLTHSCAGTTPGNGEEPENGEKPENGDEAENGDKPDNGEDPESGEEPEAGLPVTGSPASRLVGVGAGLLVAGAAMAAGVAMLAARRRRQLAELTDG